jgi:hypothetical protein
MRGGRWFLRGTCNASTGFDFYALSPFPVSLSFRAQTAMSILMVACGL